jgi:retron-type reverse transcriptase
MKTISQIIAGAQALLNLSYDLIGCFEEYLLVVDPDMKKYFDTVNHNLLIKMVREGR